MKKQEETRNQQPQSINNQPEVTTMQQQQIVPVDQSEMAEQGRMLKEQSESSSQAQFGAKLKAGAKKKADKEAPKRKPNNTGIPDRLKTSVEAMSGVSLDAVNVHYNSEKPALMNAHAYAEGTNVYVARGQEKHLAHELWHVVQQLRKEVRPTVQLKAKKQGSDDSRLERQAEKNGQQAKQYAQVPDLLPKKELEHKTSAQEIVQRVKVEKKSNYGTFSVDDAQYDFNADKTRLNYLVDFQPNDDVDATKVGLSQKIRNKKGGDAKGLNPNQETKMTADGFKIDMASKNPNPLYAVESGTANIGTKDNAKLEDYSTDSNYGQHAEKDATGWKSTAQLYDAPTINSGNNSSKEFETAAVVLEGGDKGKYYGSVEWGWEKDGTGKLSKIAFNLISEGAPSKTFLEAAKKWNSSKTLASIEAKEDDTKVYEIDFATELFTLAKGTKVLHEGNYTENNIQYNKIKVKEGAEIGRVGYVKVSDFKDSGDGKYTVDLPLVDVKVTTIDDLQFGERKDVCLATDPLLSKGTRLKIIEEDGFMVKVEIVQGSKTGDQGWVKKDQLKDE